MKPLTRKVYLSILTSLLVLIVTITTTYAWTGILSYASTDPFNIGLEKIETSDYSIQISLDGKNFSDGIPLVEIKRSILSNMDLNVDVSTLPSNAVERLFSGIGLLPVSMKRNNNDVGLFASLEEFTKEGFKYENYSEESALVKKSYFKFDLYLSFEYRNPEVTEETILKKQQEVYLSNLENMMHSTSKSIFLANSFTFKNYFPFKKFTEATVYTSSSARTSLAKYEVVEKGKPELYEGKSPTKTYIYQGGTALPTENADGSYSFGGIMPAEDNIGFAEYNKINDKKQLSNELLEEFQLSRAEEISIIGAPQQWIVTKEDNLTVQKMIKFSICMWIEGFDADCFNVVSFMPVTFNLIFSTRSDDLE